MGLQEELLANREKGASRLLAEYGERLTAVAVSLCKSKANAEDLVMQTATAAVDRIHTFRKESEFFAWLCGIMKNIHCDSVKRKSVRNEVSVANLPDAAAPDGESRIIQAVDAGIVREALDTLPREMKDALLLHYFMDMSVAKMAKILSIPTGTVKSRLHFARIALASRLCAKTRRSTALVVAFIAMLMTATAAIVAARKAAPAAAQTDSAGDSAVNTVEKELAAEKATGDREAAESSAVNAAVGEPAASVPAAPSMPAPAPVQAQLQTSDKGETSVTPKNAKAVVAAAAVAIAPLAAVAGENDGYVESKGNFGLNAGYCVGPNTKIELDYQLTEVAVAQNQHPVLMGFQGPGDGATDTERPRFEVYLGRKGETGSVLSFSASKADGTRQAFNFFDADTDRHTLVIDLPAATGQFKVLTGVEESYSSGSILKAFLDKTSFMPLGVFGQMYCGSTYPEPDTPGYRIGNYSKMKVYGLRIYELEDGAYVLKRDFAPCLKGVTAEGPTAGFKDAVSGYFTTGLRTDTAYWGGDITVEKDDPYVSTERNDVVAGPVTGGSIELDTKYRMKTYSRVELDFAPLTPRWTGSASYGNHSASFLAAYNDTTTCPNICAGAGSGYIVCRLGTSGYTNLVKLADAYGIRRTISMSSNTIAMVTSGFTNVVVTVPHGTGIEKDISKTMTIGSFRGSSEFAPMKIYGLKIYESDVLVRDYRPIVTNGVPWLQDALNPETLCGPDTYGGGSRTNIVMEAGGDFICTDGSDEAYLELSGADKWIQTDCLITKDSRIEADFSLWKTGNAQYQQQFFLQDSSAGGIFAKLWITSDNKIAYVFRDHVAGNTSGTATTIVPSNERRQYVLDGPNGRVAIKRGDEALYDEAMQGTRSNTGGATNLKIGSYSCCMRLYGLRVSTNDVPVADFVPYSKDGEAGLYDLVGHKFYPRANEDGEPVGRVRGARSRNAEGVPVGFQVAPLPAKTTKSDNDVPTLTCLASGALRYEWYADGALVEGESGDSLVVNWKKLKPPYTVEYSVVPVYDVFNETVRGDPATAVVTMPPKGTAIVVK